MSVIFTYSFPSGIVTQALGDQLYGGHNTTGSMTQGYNPDLQSLASATQYSTNSALTSALYMWSSVADIHFHEGVSENNIAFSYWNASHRGSGTTYGVGSPVAGAGESPSLPDATSFYIMLNQNSIFNGMMNQPTFNNWGVWTIAHEIGHVFFGAGHPDNGLATNDLRFSIMKYPNNTDQIPNLDVPIPLTVGMADIYNAQQYAIAHGANLDTMGGSKSQDGNTTYTFTNTTVNLSHGIVNIDPSKAVMTIWDRPTTANENGQIDNAGGNDTIDASAMSSSVYITLEAGKFSSIGSNIKDAPSNGVGGVEYNVGIAINAQIENAKGGGKNDTLIGNELNNTLDGGIGADVLQGGAGNDTYVVDNVGDLVTENAGEGTADWVRSSIGYTLGVHLENLVLTGASAINGTGNELNNILMGNSANNRLEGKGGNDIYTVNSTGDVIVEQQGGGTDTVYTTANITMAANVENLVVDLTATLTVTGNELNNLMIGNAVANNIRGGKGHDTINGGGGNDSLWGDTSLINGANATNSANGGNDTLRGGDGADNVYGESGDDTLYGDSGNDNLDGGFGHDVLYGGLDNDGLTGGKGNDTLLGGLGNDAYKFAQIAPTTLESLGKDTIQDEDYSGTVLMGAALLSSATVKAGAENTWIANTGETIIASGDVNSGRVDLQILGNWTTHLNLADRVRTLDVTIKDFSNGDLGITLGGVSNHHFRGDDNANTMAGSAGADTLVGKKGDDTYTLNHSGDRVVEFSNEGVDTVNSHIDAIELSANVENLTLIGDAVLGKGNTQANVIIGNAQDNQLLGAEGNDTLEGGLGLDMLDGGLGADTLTGGLGSDIFKYSSYLDSQPLSLFDVITDFSSSDFDRIDLSLLDAISTTSTKETFIYVGTDAFTGAGQLRFDVASQALFADFNGDTYADFQIVLTGVNQLLATDLIV